jgi:two-component system response regulator RegA
MRGDLLLVDDDPVFARVLGRALQARGFSVATELTLGDAASRLGSTSAPPRYAVLDLNLAGDSGLKLVPAVRRASPGCRIVILTGYASIATAVDAIKLGADQYLAKPVDVEAIVNALVEQHSPDAATAPQEILSMPRLEWEHIQRALAEHRGNVSATARALKMHRRTLQRKLGKHPVRD